MKFINLLERITGVEIFPLVSLIIFVIFFSLLIVYVVTADKQRMRRNSEIPLN